MRKQWRERWQVLALAMGGVWLVLSSLLNPVEAYHSPHSVDGQRAFQLYLVEAVPSVLPSALSSGAQEHPLVPPPPIPIISDLQPEPVSSAAVASAADSPSIQAPRRTPHAAAVAPPAVSVPHEHSTPTVAPAPVTRTVQAPPQLMVRRGYPPLSAHP